MAEDLPAAWEECASSVCPDASDAVAKKDDKEKSIVSKKGAPASTCTTPCDCRLFSCPKGQKNKNPEWEWEYDPNSISHADAKDFKWICAKPVLDGDDTICSTGVCQPPIEKELDNKLKSISIRCHQPEDEKTCTLPCKCRLFRWEKGKRKKKWERVAPPATKEDGYEYACFCIN